jgi:hypothetical protein
MELIAGECLIARQLGVPVLSLTSGVSHALVALNKA